MDILFENRYYSTKKMMAEFGRKYAVGPTWPKLIGFWVMYVVVVIPMLVASDAFDGTSRILMSILGITMLAVSFLPQLYAWSAVTSAKKQNDGVAPEVIITFGETIKLHEGMVDITVEYRKIQKVVRLKHSYMLMIGKRNGLMLDPEGFTKGTFEEFKQFLRDKRPDLKIPE